METVSTTTTQHRVRIFVDFWNFQLSMKNVDEHFKIDWTKLPHVLVRRIADVLAPDSAHYAGMHVYGSYDRNKPNDVRLKNWFMNFLDKQPGTNVVLQERQKKRAHPKCPKCQAETLFCHVCKEDMRGTEEKGVDTRMATDLISLAWANSYDVALLVSADRDFVPVAEFLQTKGIKIIHGAFPPNGSLLSQKCWANIVLPNLMPEFKRA
jgi:uncharacterized LabA/DUF88 family protein